MLKGTAAVTASLRSKSFQRLAVLEAAAAEQVAEHHLRLTLLEGKYHQVKRMLAAVGNRVEALHRSQIGALRLPADLAPGQWRWLSESDLSALKAV